MGSGLAKVFSKNNTVFLYNHHYDKAQILANKISAQAVHSIEEVLDRVDLILLSIKPKDLEKVSECLKGKTSNNQVIVSVLSATSHEVLETFLGKARILRMMPNISCFHGSGLVALADNTVFSDAEKNIYQKAFEPLGKVFWIEESKFDAFTALGGSGPAFAFVIIESMIDAGIALGLSMVQSREIAIQMFSGAIKTLKETGKHPGELKWEVTSPGGCTIAGIKTLEDESLRSGIINTFLSTYEQLKVK